MIKQKSKCKGLLKGAALGFAFIMCSAFFPVATIAHAAGKLEGENLSVNSIKVNGEKTSLTVKKGETVKVPDGEYIDTKGVKHNINNDNDSSISSSVRVFYKATNDEVTVTDKSFVASRVGRYTIVYSVVENEITYSYDLDVKCEVSEANFEFSNNSENIIPNVYDKKLTDKDIVLPLPAVKDSEDEEIISNEQLQYFTNSKADYVPPVGDKEGDYVLISLSLSNKEKLSVKRLEKEGKLEGFYLAGEDLAKLDNGQEIKVFYSYYQKQASEDVFISSTSKTFTVRDGYYKDSDKNNGYELETSWSTSTSDLSAVVGVERELPKITATTKSTNSPANEAVEVYYTVKVEKTSSNGSTDVTDKVYKDGKFKATEEGTYKFTYTVRDFYGNTVKAEKTTFIINNVKDSRSANVYVYDAGTTQYNETDNSYKSALNMLKCQTGNRNIVMYAVGGTDNFKAHDSLVLRRAIRDNTGVTMFEIKNDAYHGYNLIFAPGRATGASTSSSIYKQIVDDNYHIRSQMLLSEDYKNINDEAVIKAFLKSHKYLLVTTEFNKFDNSTIIENLVENEESTKKLIDEGFAYIKPVNQNRKDFKDGTYTFVYGASDEINSETTSTYSFAVSADYDDNSIPTLSFSSDLQAVYLASDKIEFNVATATDSTSQDSRLETVTAYRYLADDKTTPVASDKTTSDLRYYIRNASPNLSSKWYAQVNQVVESKGWYVDETKSTYSINLGDKPQGAKYVEILAYSIDDYGNAGFFNKIIRIADVEDEIMPTLFKVVNMPTEEDVYDAPSEITLPTLSFTDDNVGYMTAQVNVYKITNVDGENDKTLMQSANMTTEYDTHREIFTVKGGTFRASTSGKYQVAITVKDAGNHSYTTYFHYNVGGGVVYEKPEIKNITTETIDLKAGQYYYLTAPTLSITKNEAFGYIGVEENDDANTATYYTTSVISNTDDYELNNYYFTGSKKGTFKLQYKVYLMQYSKDSKVFASSEAGAVDGNIYLDKNGKLVYKHGGEKYFVYIDQNEEGEYVVNANTSLLGIGGGLNSTEMEKLEKIVTIYTCLSKIKTINVGGVDMDITLDDNMYAESYDTLGTTIPIVKPRNISYNGSGYQTNAKDSTVTITKTSGNTTTTLATFNLEDWEKDIPENNSNFSLKNGEVYLKLADNGRYVIKYSIQAMDKNGTNVGDAKTIEYTIKNGDVIGPELELEKNLVKAKYKKGEELILNIAGITVSDNIQTTTRDQLLSTMKVQIKNTSLGENYTTIEPKDEEEGKYVYTKKLENAGSYTLTITIKDEAGNETSQSVSFKVSTDEKKDVDVKEVMGGVLIGLSVAILAGVVIYFVVSKVKLDKKEKKYKDK